MSGGRIAGPGAAGTLPEEQVRAMFDRIARVYDLMNSVMTVGLHHRWRERAADLAALLREENTYIYVCGLKSMEEGVVLALRDVATDAGLSWDTLGPTLKREGRLHLETY